MQSVIRQREEFSNEFNIIAVAKSIDMIALIYGGQSLEQKLAEKTKWYSLNFKEVKLTLGRAPPTPFLVEQPFWYKFGIPGLCIFSLSYPIATSLWMEIHELIEEMV